MDKLYFGTRKEGRKWNLGQKWEEHNRMCRELINTAITNEDRITKKQQAEK